MHHIPNEGISAKGSYLDDAFTKSRPKAAAQILKTIRALEAKTNLVVKVSKCHLHAPNNIIAKECKNHFASNEEIKIHSNMNLTFLNTPIGADDFVEAELENKLDVLRTKIDSIAELPFKMDLHY